MWAIEEWDVVPDILVIGKGLSGAIYPMSATCHRPHLDRFFQENPFIHLRSFGGVGAGLHRGAGRAGRDHPTRVPGSTSGTMGDRFAAGFAQLQGRYPMVAGWRQRGLMIGLESIDDRIGPPMTMGLAQNGVLAVFANHRPARCRSCPR